MKKEALQKIFNETYDEYMTELMDEEKFNEKISKYSDENGILSPAQMLAFAYNESFERSTHFMWDVFKKICDLKENNDSKESN